MKSKREKEEDSLRENLLDLENFETSLGDKEEVSTAPASEEIFVQDDQLN